MFKSEFSHLIYTTVIPRPALGLKDYNSNGCLECARKCFWHPGYFLNSRMPQFYPEKNLPPPKKKIITA